MKKVLFILNNAPNYRDIFLKELAKEVDLTVMSRSGSNIGLNDPTSRNGYKYIELRKSSFFGVNFNFTQFTEGYKNYEVIIIGPSLREPFALLNLLRRNKKKILFGHIYSLNKVKEPLLSRIVKKWTWKNCNSFLVHSDYIRNRLVKETKKPIYSFNNTYFFENQIHTLPVADIRNGIHILWIGRFREENYRIKNITYLLDIANRNTNVVVRLIGSGIRDGLKTWKIPHNVELYDEIFDDQELEKHYRWCHLVMNPGIIGLLVMNTARFGRPIVLDENGLYGPEVQLALDSGQPFIDFNNTKDVDQFILSLQDVQDERLKHWGSKMAEIMRESYTMEYMLSQFLKAIEN